MNTMKVLAAGLAVSALTAVTACSGTATSSGNDIISSQQNKQDIQYAYTQPLPYFPFSQIRQDLIEIEAINALGIASTTFMFVQGITNPVLICPSIGVPIPVTDQSSNPLVPEWNGRGGTNNRNYSDAGVAIGQEEPMGVFTGDSSGTNSLCVNNTGGQFEGYNEAYDISVTAPAYWDPNFWGPGKGYIRVTGTPVMPVCSVQSYTANGKKQYEEVCIDPSKKAK